MSLRSLGVEQHCRCIQTESRPIGRHIGKVELILPNSHCEDTEIMWDQDPVSHLTWLLLCCWSFQSNRLLICSSWLLQCHSEDVRTGSLPGPWSSLGEEGHQQDHVQVSLHECSAWQETGSSDAKSNSPLRLLRLQQTTLNSNGSRWGEAPEKFPPQISWNHHNQFRISEDTNICSPEVRTEFKVYHVCIKHVSVFIDCRWISMLLIFFTRNASCIFMNIYRHLYLLNWMYCENILILKFKQKWKTNLCFSFLYSLIRRLLLFNNVDVHFPASRISMRFISFLFDTHWLQ